MALLTEIGRLVSAGESQLQSLTETKQRHSGEVTTYQQSAAELEQQLKQLVDAKQKLQHEAEATDSELARSREQFDQHKTELAEWQDELTKLSNRQAGLTQRAKVIEELEKRRGHPVVLNTSLNRRGEPMVCTPTDALNMFYGSDLPFLIMENVLVRK